jgi:hypothetical protein
MSRTSVRHACPRSPPGAPHRPHSPAPHPSAGQPLLRAVAVGRRRVGVAAGHQPAAPPAGRAAGHRLPGALPPAHQRRTVRGAVGGGGTVGAPALQRRLVPGRQTPQPAPGRRLPTAQARPGPGPLLPRNLHDPGPTGATAGRQGPPGAMGAAGSPAAVSGRAGPRGACVVRRRGIAVASTKPSTRPPSR